MTAILTRVRHDLHLSDDWDIEHFKKYLLTICCVSSSEKCLLLIFPLSLSDGCGPVLPGIYSVEQLASNSDLLASASQVLGLKA